LHADAINIDHAEPLKVGGKDDPSNFALTHSSCNRSKQASDLRVARFVAIRDKVAPTNEGRGSNLGDILGHYGGAVHDLRLARKDSAVQLSFRCRSAQSGNSGGYGGGIDNEGTLWVSNSTLSGNSGDFGGGI
jgi:hypothetical protein